MSELTRVLIERDGISEDEAEMLVDEARESIEEGEEPDEVLMDMFGLEPDYLEDLL